MRSPRAGRALRLPNGVNARRGDGGEWLTGKPPYSYGSNSQLIVPLGKFAATLLIT